DAGRDFRQVHSMDTSGRAAAWTGQKTAPAAGHRQADHVSVAGNLLSGLDVLVAVVDAWLDQTALPWPERLLVAMQAGEAAGGDRRGRQSAAMRIHGGEPYADLDLRVDNATNPLLELESLVAE